MDYVALKAEITNDPEGLGYGQIADTATYDRTVAQLLNNRVRTGEVARIAVSKIFDCIDSAEYMALSADHKELVKMLMSVQGEVGVLGSNAARLIMLNAFGAGTTTRSRFRAAIALSTSRAEELGFDVIEPSDVAIARNTV
jgi:hypothetical protein